MGAFLNLKFAKFTIAIREEIIVTANCAELRQKTKERGNRNEKSARATTVIHDALTNWLFYT